MKINILFFANLKQYSKNFTLCLENTNEITLLELQDILVQKIPELKKILNNIAFAINQEYVTNSNVKIVDHDEVALIPPVSGG